jgi:hypothetical protein
VTTVLERIELRPALGLRFVDPAAGGRSVEGLAVTARRADEPAAPAVALTPPRSGAGAWSLHRELGPELEINVVDPARRFLPLAFRVHPSGGLVLDPCAAPAAGVRGIPLFSAPNRPVPPGLGVVRAHLVSREDPQGPASWALVEARIGGVLAGRGLAGPSGEVLLLLPWPALPQAVGGPHAVDAQTWPVRLSARWDPAFAGAAGPPELCDLLAQPVVRLLDRANSNVPLVERDLVFGAPLTVTTTDTPDLLLDPTP